MERIKLSQLRAEAPLELPKVLRDLEQFTFVESQKSQHQPEIEKLFPHTHNTPFFKGERGKRVSTGARKIGVLFSGGQAAGGHNVIVGLYDAFKKLTPNFTLLGFLNGPSGVVEGKWCELSKEILSPFRNQGGFDLLGSGRTKIDTDEKFRSALKTVKELSLDALVIIGGDDSNTNAALLAEYFIENGAKTQVIGVPKTIDGDLQNECVEISFGFDTACRTYSELIGNIARDALSAKKYTHFIKLMGRSASHVALECAFATQPNLALISEEVAAKGLSLSELTKEIAALVTERANKGKNYGVILIPEGLIEHIPEINQLIKELNQKLAKKEPEHALKELSSKNRALLESLPESIQKELLLDRDPHGNVQVSKIHTEELLIELVKRELKRRGDFSGKFSPVPHFFGYEGRSAYPTSFDSHYCYALGFAAALLIDSGKTGYMAAIKGLRNPVEKWDVYGVPLTSLLKFEERKGEMKPVIEKALVDLEGKAFRHFVNEREKWTYEDRYLFPGPIQFFGEFSSPESYPHILQ